MKTARHYGWKRQGHDPRDLRLKDVAPPQPAVELPPSWDLLTDTTPPVYDQGQLGSCTANAIAAALQFEEARQGLASPMPSRLFIYYAEREMEGTIPEDGGAVIRDGIKAVNQFGAPPEAVWPYDISRFAEKPSPAAYAEALKYRAVQYLALEPDWQQIKACIYAGFPAVFGMIVYEAFESQEVAESGVLPPMPSGRVMGGHAVLAVGYDDDKCAFLVRNSWGSGWGQNGHFWMPYFYTPQATSDWWTIRLVEEEGQPTAKV